MTWTELRVETTPAAADLVAEFMLEVGLTGVGITITDDGAACCAYQPPDSEVQPLVEPLQRRLDQIAPSLTNGHAPRLSTREVTEEDWAEAWKQHFQPLRIGRGMVVRPSWADAQARPGDVVIELDPGMAFGTGTHPTTQMCLEAVEELLRPGDVAIDVGAGSGILAIAAAKLGARRVVAIDNDPVAARVVNGNARRNGVADVVEVRLEHGLDGAIEPADLIVANINSEAVCALAPNAAALLTPGGSFVSAGMTDASVGAVRRALEAAGLKVACEKQQAEWVCLIAQH